MIALLLLASAARGVTTTNYELPFDWELVKKHTNASDELREYLGLYGEDLSNVTERKRASLYTMNQFEADVHTLTNQQRTSMGLKPLYASRILIGVARAHSQDMYTQNFFDHTNLRGESPFQRMSNAGYRYSTAAENIAQGQRTPDQVMNSWMNSPGHRANILNGNLREIGVGISTQQFYWTQAFATPQSACGNGFVEGSETCDTGDAGCAACMNCRLAAGASCAARGELEGGQLCCTGGSPPAVTPAPPPATTRTTVARTPFPTPATLPGETPPPTPPPTPLPPGETLAPDVCSDVVSCIGCVDMELSPCKWCKYTAGATKCIPKGQTCTGQAISSLLVCDEKPAERKCTDINIASNKCSDCVQSDLDCQWCTSGRRCIDRSSAASASCPQGVVRDVNVCAQYDNELNGEDTLSSSDTGIFITPDAPSGDGLPTWLIAVIAVLAVIVLCLVGAAIVMALISRKERKEADELRKWAEDTGAKPADFAPTNKGDLGAPPLLVRDHSTVVAVATSKPLPPVSGTFKPLPSSPGGTFKPLPAAPLPMAPASPRALPAYQDMQLQQPAPASLPPLSFNVADRAPAHEAPALDPFKAAAPIPGAGRNLPQLPPPTRRALPPPPAAPVAPVLETATALYDFEGSQPGDLSFKEGDVIKLIDTSLSWWKGEVNGVIGSFPNNYAQKN